jgi:hypothetical protein
LVRAATGYATGAARALLRMVAHSAGVADDAFVEAVRVTIGLMDEWDVARGAGGVRVSLGRHLPERATIPTPGGIESIRTEVATLQPGTPPEELAERNRQLMAALQDVQRQREEPLRLGELAETNNGVVALYAELSGELEATNRGVVALYADTDGRIEWRTESIDLNILRLVDAVAHVETDLEAFASRLLHEVGPAVANDDIAMVALRRTPPLAEGPGQWHS